LSAPDTPASLGHAPAVLSVLVALTVATPWAFGGVMPWTTSLVTAVALLACAAGFARASLDKEPSIPAVALWPLAGLLAVVALQLVPLPGAVHAVVASASHEVWAPASAAAQAVIGTGPHPISVHPEATLRSLLFTTGVGGLALLAAPALARGPNALRAAWTVTIAGTATAVYGILAKARYGDLLYGTIPVPTVSPFGPFVSKNHFAAFVGMAALLAAGLAAALAGRARGAQGHAPAAALAMAATAAMALGVLVSLSRGGALSLVCGALAFAALRAWRHGRAGRLRRWLPSLALALVVSGLVVFALPREGHQRLRSLAGWSVRSQIWRDTVHMAAASPWIGHGLGGYADAHTRFKQGHGDHRVEHAENDYLEMLAEVGLAGAVFTVAAVLALGAPYAARGAAAAPGALVAGAGAGLVLILVHSGVDFNLRIPSNALMAALLASFVASGAPRRKAGRRATLALAALFAAAAVPATAGLRASLDPSAGWAHARAEARRASVTARPEARALHLQRTEQALGDVIRRRPAHAEAWLLLAGVRAQRGDPSAAELARHAARLDPARRDLQDAARRLADRGDSAVAVPP
jgi:O-antigen ligase